MRRRNFLTGVTIAGMVALAGISSFAKLRQSPNIVWIFSDDHSIQTIGAYGGRFKKLNPTPNIDTLARDGMIFKRCYVGNSICAPSRATLLTGKHSHLNGKYDNSGGFNQGQQTFPKILRKHGYQTAMIGKIHLPGKMQGFDYWEVLPGQGRYNNPKFITEEGTTGYKGYVTDIITDKALEWLTEKRDKSKPFMLMIHHKAPHRNWIPAKRDMARYADIDMPEPDNLFDDYKTRTTAAHKQDMNIKKTMRMQGDLKVNPGNPRATTGQYAKRNKFFNEHKLEGRDLVKWKYQIYLKDYLRCIWSVDENIGRVLKYLEDNGLSDNTIVMYSSDQGFYMGEHGWFDKRFMYEESFRTPLLVRWPGVVKKGSINNDLTQNIDFAETFLDLAGIPIPDDMQGVSLVPLLKGETPKDWRKYLYYHYYEYPGCHKVRRHEGIAGKRYKLIRFYGKHVPGGEEWELYDLDKDPKEMNNIYNNPEYATKIKKLKTELSKLKTYYKVPDHDNR